MTQRSTSVAMTATTEKDLLGQLVRLDGQEDLCLATYRPSTGLARVSALVNSVIPPEPRDRHIHGNVTVTAEYVLRARGNRPDSELRPRPAPQPSGRKPVAAHERSGPRHRVKLRIPGP